MSFYEIAGLFINSYLWFTLFWNVGSGYDWFDRKEWILSIFCWEFVKKKLSHLFVIFMKDIQSIIIKVKEDIYVCGVLYMNIKGWVIILLTQIDENLTIREIEQF